MSAEEEPQGKIEAALHKQLNELAQLIVVPEDLPDEKDDIEAEAEKALKSESAFYAKALHEQELADRSQARTQRETYARGIFTLVSIWIVLIFILLLLQGFSGLIGYRPLSDSVLITLISSTTINVIATLIIVLKYIFNVPVSRSEATIPTFVNVDQSMESI